MPLSEEALLPNQPFLFIILKTIRNRNRAAANVPRKIMVCFFLLSVEGGLKSAKTRHKLLTKNQTEKNKKKKQKKKKKKLIKYKYITYFCWEG